MTSHTLLFPPLDLLTLHLEALILENQQELEGYFSPTCSNQEGRLKAQGLAHTLAKEFLCYGKFGGAALEKWGKKKGWQQVLWKEVFSKWNYPYQILDFPYHPPPMPVEVHLFNFPFLPPLYHHFFEKIAAHVSVFYYQFSPCQEFWTDIASDRERFLIQKKKGHQPELDAYLKCRNPLLANMGKLTQETFCFFAEEDFLLEENYTSPSSSLLGMIQSDMFHNVPVEPKSVSPDSSLSLHGAFSKLREVEILYANLTKISSLPSEIQIFAPDIAPYAPYIELVFGAEDSPFPFHIRDLPHGNKSAFLQLLFELLSLPEKRFDLKSTLKFLSHSLVRAHFDLREKAVETFGLWMEKIGVKWGLDPMHRHHLLSRSMLEKEGFGTWEHAFTKLLEQLAFLPQTPPTWDLPSPLFSEAESLGQLIALIRSLKKELDQLETPMTLLSWSSFLRSLTQTYFSIPKKEQGSFHFFCEKLALLETLGRHIPETLFPFSSIKRFLQNGLTEKGGGLSSKQLESLTFSSLKGGHLFPVKVIYLLGMEEGKFPRPFTKTSLTQFEGDFCPSPSDQDRSIFLELLFTPRERLYISYLQFNEKDGKEQLPSLLVQELLSYLKTYYHIEKEALTQVHPSFAFHHTSSMLCFSKRHYQTALSFYKRSSPLPFIPEFLTPSPLPDTSKASSLHVHLKHLLACAKHPLRFYFNHVLGVYLKYPSQDEEFVLSPLNKVLLQNTLLTSPLQNRLQEARDHGKLPLGRFREVAHLKLEEEIDGIKEHLEMFAIKEVEAIPLSHTLSLPHQKEVHIEGVLENITPQGMLFAGEVKELLKIWPAFLLFSCLKQVKGEKRLLFVKTGTTFSLSDPEEALSNFLTYYTRALQTPSPFLPIWSEIFLKKTSKALESAITQKLKGGSDPYINWGLASYSAPVIFDTWASYLREVFKALPKGSRG